MKSAKALPRYGSGHKSAGRTDGQPDGRTDRQRQNNIPPPLAGDNKVCNSKSVQNGVHRFEQPYLHQSCSDFHDLGLIQRRNEFPFWKCICLAIFLQMLGQLLRNNTIHNSHDPVNSDHVVFKTEIFTE
ncbi:hypothetical protein DPMN_121583 [Dreissena polymorpha]|uniref:Uncharacterized protein n=1 Tax=Dreissena polymorpha TaxID=45954 RepID=A0A9D4GLV8_DREPO|nr:hypothetical protein DPMN_121583 [Dreissena polymorpha]